MTVDYLRSQGHNVLDIRGSELEGITDNEVWNLAQQEKRVLVSTDKWFASIMTTPHFGVLIVLLKHPNRQRIHERVLLGLETFSEADWGGLIVTMRDNVRTLRRVSPE